MTPDDKAVWRDEARSWILENVAERERFSANELWPRGIPQPDNRRLLGSVLLGLESEGVLDRVGRTASEKGHGGSIIVWVRRRMVAALPIGHRPGTTLPMAA